MNENIKLVCFDLDHTLINGNSWKNLNLGLGISKELDRQWYKEYKSGLISYEEWNNRILELYMKHENSNREGLTKILSNYTYAEGAKEAVAYLIAKGYEIVLISGSIDTLLKMISEELGIKYFKANNSFVFDENDKLIGIHSDGGDEIKAKADHLENFCEMLGIDIKECACIADGANDLEMFRRTGHGITFVGSEIEDQAWKVVKSFHDIKEIL